MKPGKHFSIFVIAFFIWALAACSSPDIQEADVPPVVAPTTTPTEVVVQEEETPESVEGVEETPVPTAESAGFTPRPDSPTVTATAVPTETIQAELVKPGMPAFVTEEAPACGTSNEFSQYLGQDADFSTALYTPLLDGRHDMVVFYIPVDSDYMHYYVWMGEPLEKYPGGSTYLIVRFDSDTCDFEQYQEWAESHLDDAQDWADSFNEWQERSLEPAEEATVEGTPVANPVKTEGECGFDENPNAFILKANEPNGVNYVVTNPVWGWVTISTTDGHTITVGQGYEQDGCYRLPFTVQHSGAMNLVVEAQDGTILAKHNFYSPFDFWADFDAP